MIQSSHSFFKINIEKSEKFYYSWSVHPDFIFYQGITKVAILAFLSGIKSALQQQLVQKPSGSVPKFVLCSCCVANAQRQEMPLYSAAKGRRQAECPLAPPVTTECAVLCSQPQRRRWEKTSHICFQFPLNTNDNSVYVRASSLELENCSHHFSRRLGDHLGSPGGEQH